MNQETEEQKTERYKAHLDGNIENSLVRSVLSEDTNFVGEVENFYDLSAEERCIEAPGIVLGSRTYFEAGERNPQKTGQYPEDLVEILQGFDEKPFDSSKLRYEAVREDYGRWQDPSRRKAGRRMAMFLGGEATAAIGLIYGIGSLFANIEAVHAKFLIENPWVAGATALGTLIGGFYMANKGFRNPPAPKGTNNELWEYKRLHETAETADGFMDEHYKNHFIRKTLGKNR